MQSTHDELATALTLHQSGELGQAAQCYQRILARDQANADALHLLGVLHHQRGDYTRAIDLIGKAIAFQPGASAYHSNLAETYRAVGQFERAEGCCRLALQLSAESPEALANLGAVLIDLRRYREALEPLQCVLALSPRFAAAFNNLGIAQRELGDAHEARHCFSTAVAIDLNFAAARTNLGQLLLGLGLHEEALEHCTVGARLQPNAAAVHHNLGNALRQAGRSIEARAAYMESLRLNPQLAIANAHLGLLLQDGTNPEDALPWFKRAVELEPDNATFWRYLAKLYDDLERMDLAHECWQRVVALMPDDADARVALGWACQERSLLDDAYYHYQLAAERSPHWALPHHNLGGLYEELGDFAAARASFRKAIELQPDYCLPYARLATLMRADLPDDVLAALESRLSEEKIGKVYRARMLFGLAHVMDARGEFQRASESLREANAIMQQTQPRRRDYTPEDHTRFVDRLLQVFDRDFFARWRGAGCDSQRPVFVVGLPRSGTTLVEQILASHSRIHGGGELFLARRSFEAIPIVLGINAQPIECVGQLTREALDSIAGEHLGRLEALDSGTAARIVDKMPENYMYVGLLAALFPQATFFHCRRDLRDVALSCWMTDFRSLIWANTPDNIGSRFAQYTRLTEHWQQVASVTIHTIEYSELVNDLAAVAKRMVAACQLEWEPACLQFHLAKRPVRTASVLQVRQPVHARSVERWRNYEKLVPDLFAHLTG